MRKLGLKLDDLVVESFATGRAGSGGTVLMYQDSFVLQNCGDTATMPAEVCVGGGGGGDTFNCTLRCNTGRGTCSIVNPECVPSMWDDPNAPAPGSCGGNSCGFPTCAPLDPGCASNYHGCQTHVAC